MDRHVTVSHHFYFISSYLTHGFGDIDLFPGRMKVSTDVDKDDPKFLTKVNYARKHHLWHYHIGIPCYEGTNERPRGDWLSAYLLNFQKFSETKIKLVDLNSHPPFSFPHEDDLEGDEAIAPESTKQRFRVVK